MAWPNRDRYAKRGLGCGGIVFLLGASAMCFSPQILILAALLALAPIVWGTRLVRVIGIALCAASALLAISRLEEECTSSRTGTRATADLAMKTALRDLDSLQEHYLAVHATYSTSLDSLGFTNGAPASDVTVTIGSATATGWNATATHRRMPGRTCARFGGSGPAVAPAVYAGETTCGP
jgi:hypothetical protein